MLVDGPYFQATDEGELVFLMSDGDTSRRPTEHDILEPDQENTTLQQNYYLRIPLEHVDSQRWRTEIAKYLAPLVLGTTMGTLPWTLGDFPQGYALLLHKTPRRTEPSKARRDFYLYGATDVPSFASPLEFVKHAEWLMRGARRTPDTRRSPRCSCKYCSQHAYVSRDADAEGNAAGDGAGAGAGASSSVRSAHLKNLKNRADKRQSVISRGLRRVRARVLARIKNEEGDGDGGGGGDDGNDGNDNGDGGGEEDVDEVMEDVEERGGAGEEQGGGTGEEQGGGTGEAGEGVGERPEVENGVGIDADVVDVNVNVETTNAVPTTEHGANGTD